MELTGLFIGVALISFVIVVDLWLTRAERRADSRARLVVYVAFGGFAAIAGITGATFVVWNLIQSGSPGVLPGLLLAVGLTGALTLARASRRLLARVIPFEPSSLRTTIGLTMILWFAEVRIADFIVGEPVETSGISYASLVIQAATLVGIGLALVGVPHRRSLRDAMNRLGVVVPTSRQAGQAVLLVIGVFALAIIATSLLNAMAPEVIQELEETSDEMTAELGTFWGALAIGLGAALGEELLFRGSLQPRYGIIFTALIFSVLHVQYHPALIFTSVLPAGIVLGLERKYLNTTACMITHMLYNTIAVLLGG